MADTFTDLFDLTDIGYTDQGFYNFLIEQDIPPKTAEYLTHGTNVHYHMQNIRDYFLALYKDELEFAYQASQDMRVHQ